ncbi:Casein kinase I hhp1 [Tritrichomonas foetus]|uniref:non-specific serine/threonine protein kinase n=1 Tax=Tritrichomonas foetus TaxID=1144522 RepID=A0A1J4JA47_9EUKA|nr:Casein kinase I hhp1 [Tritrichomonas foetus]|eukprot:OHS94507.1 Casein kinase I hhp1 [Tritrichomonas foetus]
MYTSSIFHFRKLFIRIQIFNHISQKMQHCFGDFRIGRSIGNGAFGGVYQGTHNVNKTEVAIKVSTGRLSDTHMKAELDVYNSLESEPGFPVIHGYETSGETKYLAMELLGKNLYDLFKNHNSKFSMKTALIFIDQALQRLQYLHSKGFVHCDIKPHNFCIGNGPNSNQIYLIDFGLAKRYTVFPKDCPESKRKKIDKFEGTMRYASHAAHHGYEMLPKDDLESLFYTLIYLIKGKLPWSGISNKNKDLKRESIYVVKCSVQPEELCSGLPEEFIEFYNDIRNLNICDEPNYSKYRAIFRNLFIKSQFIYDSKFDWVLSKSTMTFNFGPPKIPQHNVSIHRARSDNPQPTVLRPKDRQIKIFSPRLKPNTSMTFIGGKFMKNFPKK